MKSKSPDRYAAAKRAALNALRRAQRAAERGGVKLSEWEGEFLGSVTERVKTYGRAFADPDKGAPGQGLPVTARKIGTSIPARPVIDPPPGCSKAR